MTRMTHDEVIAALAVAWDADTGGFPGLPPGARAHAGECPECRLLLRLLEGVAAHRLVDDVPPGYFETLADRVAERRASRTIGQRRTRALHVLAVAATLAAAALVVLARTEAPHAPTELALAARTLASAPDDQLVAEIESLSETQWAGSLDATGKADASGGPFAGALADSVDESAGDDPLETLVESGEASTWLDLADALDVLEDLDEAAQADLAQRLQEATTT